MENRQCAVYKHPHEYHVCLQHSPATSRNTEPASNRQCAIHRKKTVRNLLSKRSVNETIPYTCTKRHIPINLSNLLVREPVHRAQVYEFPESWPMIAQEGHLQRAWNGAGRPEVFGNAVNQRVPCMSGTCDRLADSRLDVNRFDLLTTLGTGAFGRVKLARCRLSGKYCVLKILNKLNIVKLKQIEHTRSERSVLASIKHPFVVELYATFQDPYRLYFVLEFVQGGELFFVLRDHGRFSEVMARFYASEVACALEYLHSHKIVYRDLKPENVLITRTGHIKLTDFGFSKYVFDATWTLCGTPDYLAPEILLNMPYGKTVDWWALGVLLYEMLTGKPPFYDEDLIKLYEKILTCQVSYPQYLTPSAAAIIGHLLEPDLTKRYGNLHNGAEDIKSDRWFQGIDWVLANQAKLRPPYIPTTSSECDTRNFDRYDEYTPEDSADRVVSEDFNILFKDF